MKNIFKLFLICLLFTGCFAKKQNEFKIEKTEKLTFIFDFDAKTNSIIQVNAKKGFYSDYFYQISDLATKDKEIYIAIIPNNTPGTIIPEDDDDYKTLCKNLEY
jgi:hypothetical protein